MERNYLLIWRVGLMTKVEWLETLEEMDEVVLSIKDRYENDATIDEAIKISVDEDFSERYNK